MSFFFAEHKKNKTCTYVSSDGTKCERKHKSKGYCNIHYQRYLEGSDMDMPIRENRKKRPETCICVFSDGTKCERKHRAKGYCGMHYYRNKKGLDMDAPIQGSFKTCTYVYSDGTECERKHGVKGYCDMHDYRNKKGLDMDAISRGSLKTCTYVSSDGTKCERKHKSKGYCNIHYQRYLKGSDMDMPIRRIIKIKRRRSKLKEGDRSHSYDGYVFVKTLNKEGKYKRVGEHRYVVQKALEKIGQILNEDETVHHKNGIRDDNRLENLEIRPAGNHPRGVTIPDKLNFSLYEIKCYVTKFCFFYPQEYKMFKSSYKSLARTLP